MKTNEKVLFFEGAGNVERGEVANCRIRTAFINDKGEKCYVELSGNGIHKYNRSYYPTFKIGDAVMSVWSASIINKDDDFEHMTKLEDKKGNTLYTYANILKYVNDTFNCSFTSVKVLNYPSAYRVFGKHNTINYMNDYKHDEQLEAQHKKVLNYFKEIDKKELNKKYSNLSYIKNGKGAEILMHYNGFNDWVYIQDVNIYDFDYKVKKNEIEAGKRR